jgi:hypothetical protein
MEDPMKRIVLVLSLTVIVFVGMFQIALAQTQGSSVTGSQVVRIGANQAATPTAAPTVAAATPPSTPATAPGAPATPAAPEPTTPSPAAAPSTFPLVPVIGGVELVILVGMLVVLSRSQSK